MSGLIRFSTFPEVLQYCQEVVQESRGKTKLEPNPQGWREAGHHSHRCLLGKPVKGSYQQNGALQKQPVAGIVL